MGAMTKATNKHLLPVGRIPMIFHAVLKLREAGIQEILVVTGTEHMGDMITSLGSGRELDVSLTYRVQDEAGGIAQALQLAREYARNAPVCVILGDNIFEAPITPHLHTFMDFVSGHKDTGPSGDMVLFSKVKDPTRYGCPVFRGKLLVDFVEKPKTPPSPYAVTGIYFFRGAEVFDIASGLRPSGRGELEIVDVHREMMHRGRLLWAHLEGRWTDAGTYESYRLANEIAWELDTQFVEKMKPKSTGTKIVVKRMP